MKTLYLVRHARAIPGDVGVNDFKRALAKQGREDAEAVSTSLDHKGIRPDIFIASPADRTLETAHIFANTLDYPIQKILLKEDIYEEDDEALREIIQGVDERYATAMIFGHEPTLSLAARYFLADFELDIPTTGVVGMTFETECWQELARHSGSLIIFDFPARVTPKTYKRAKKAIRETIVSGIRDMLKNLHVETSKPLEKLLKKTAKALTNELIKTMDALTVEGIAGTRERSRIDNFSHTSQQHAETDQQPPVPQESAPAAEEEESLTIS